MSAPKAPWPQRNCPPWARCWTHRRTDPRSPCDCPSGSSQWLHKPSQPPSTPLRKKKSSEGRQRNGDNRRHSEGRRVTQSRAGRRTEPPSLRDNYTQTCWHSRESLVSLSTPMRVRRITKRRKEGRKEGTRSSRPARPPSDISIKIVRSESVKLLLDYLTCLWYFGKSQYGFRQPAVMFSPRGWCPAFPFVAFSLHVGAPAVSACGGPVRPPRFDVGWVPAPLEWCCFPSDVLWVVRCALPPPAGGGALPLLSGAVFSHPPFGREDGEEWSGLGVLEREGSERRGGRER